MEKVLFLGYTDQGRLSRPMLEALATACRMAEALQADLQVGLLGERLSEAAGQIGGSGASRFVGVEGPEWTVSRYSSDAAAVEAICRTTAPTLVVAAGTSRWCRVLPGAAFRVGGRVDTHVCNWEKRGDRLVLTRWYYRQRIRAELTRPHRPWFIVLDVGVSEPWQGTATSVDVERIEAQAAARSQVTDLVEPPASEQTIRPDAELLFVAGAGWTKKQGNGEVRVPEAEQLILGFLQSSGASLGGSKSLVDQSGEGHKVLFFMTHLNQIGQTGATPRHPKGLATCCHGEEPHVVGWRFINERRAINLDPGCGWAQGKADVLYVADAFEVMAHVNRLLARP